MGKVGICFVFKRKAKGEDNSPLAFYRSNQATSTLDATDILK